MPRRRKSIKRRKSRKGRRRVARRKRMSRATTTVARGPSGFPDRLFVKLRYSERINQTHAVGASAVYVWRGNSLFDCNFTGGGTQPYGFDQWAALYSYYTVYGSSIKVQNCVTQNTNLAMDIAVLPSVENTVASVSDISSPVEEMPYCKYKIVGTYAVGVNDNIIRSYMSTAKIYGVNKAAVESEDNYSAAVTTNPANGWYWITVTQPVDESTAMTSTIVVMITYYAEFNTRKNLAAS